MKTTVIFIILLLFSTFFYAEAGLAITEVLKDPVGPESAIPGGESHEFIEFFNYGSDTITLDSLFISDGYTIDSVIPWQQPIAWHPNCCFNRTSVNPGQFALILDRDYAQSPVDRYYSIADSTVILTVDASSLLNKLAENRGIFLYRGTRSIIDDSLAALLDHGSTVSLHNKVYHTLPENCTEGFSCIPTKLLFSPPAFSASPDTLSLGRYEYIQEDWLCEYSCCNPGPVSPTVICTTGVLMAGQKMPLSATWEVINTHSSDVIAAGTLPSEPYPVFFTVSLPKDSVTYQLTVTENNHEAVIPLDISSVWLPSSPVKINEIFPRATAAVPEWIELVNISSMPVNLKNWRYGTPESPDNTITSADFILDPGRFCVITKDSERFFSCYPVGVVCIQPSSWQSLDNYHDTLFLYSSLEDAPCETVCYDYHWFDNWEHQSVARVATEKGGLAADAWALSNNSTPGLPNTDVDWQAGEKAALHIGPIPFTPNNDGRDDSLAIRIEKPAAQNMTIAIYSFDGKKILDVPESTGEKYTWNGRTSDGRYAPVGPFFVVATVTKGNKESYIRKKGVLWR